MAQLKKPINPARLLIFGYLIIILSGALLLYLPISSKNMTPIDALYTSTSAVCVTGLIVKSTATDFTLFGKFIILLLIQIGGLGYMTLSTTFFFFLRQKLSLRDRLVAKESFNVLNYENLKRFGFTVMRVTFVIEGLGALALFIYFLTRSQMKIWIALGHAIFTSVSAFCNAGFSTFSDNLASFSCTYFVPFVVSILIISGGFGFFVISDIYKTFIKKKNRYITTHTKTVLSTTFILILFGTLIILLLEWRQSLQDYSFTHKLMNAYFQSITPRTAGFNTLNIGILRASTQLLLIFLMFIGASPGGTGGGIKTTTFTIMILQFKTLLSGRNELLLFRRRVPREQIFKSFLIVGLAVTWLLTSLFLLLIFNKYNMSFITQFFELISAFGTVGLSLGSSTLSTVSASYDFSAIGKVVIIATMIVGRVGILTLGTALIQKKISKFTHPEGVILVG